MNQSSTEQLKKTPLNARHRAHGARMVPFGGWDMPVEYSGIVNEHLAVRTKAGLFDVSHMGEIELAGKDALAAVQKISANDAAKLSVGQAQYSALTTPAGTFVDDLLVYRLATEHYMLVVNAGNIEKAYKWIGEHARPVGDVAVVNSSSRYALLAVQGPAAVGIVQELTTVDLASIKYYWFAHGEVASVRSIISRTGYTGEDGFELFIPPASAERVWNAILDAGAEAGIVPVGLGARDTLRLEAGMHLSGQDIDETTTVLEADLGLDRRLEKERLHRQGCTRRAETSRREPQARGIRNDSSRNRAPWLQGVRGRRRRHRDERHADAASQEGDRVRVSSDCAPRRWH